MTNNEKKEEALNSETEKDVNELAIDVPPDIFIPTQELTNLNLKEEVVEYANKLSLKFEELRPFGDEKDFLFFPQCTCQSMVLCIIYRKSPFHNPERVEELAGDLKNQFLKCKKCVLKAIRAFKKFHKTTKKGDFIVAKKDQLVIENFELTENPEPLKKGDAAKLKFISMDNKVEYMWVMVIQISNQNYKGVLLNTPHLNYKNSLSVGDITKFTKDEVQGIQRFEDAFKP